MQQEKHDPESLGAKPRDYAHPPRPYWKRAHRDWRMWTVAALMLALMLVCVMADSLAFGPGNSGAEPVPAVNAP